jgi:hypothetical protein
MFSLIITIISIALVALLALATLYYGGDAFNRGSAGAQAARLINEGQQVNGAVALYKADRAAGNTPEVATLAGLVSAYMSQVPSSFAGNTALADNKVTVENLDTDVCNEVNKRAGHAAADVDNEGEEPGVFGCNTATKLFYYKF